MNCPKTRAAIALGGNTGSVAVNLADALRILATRGVTIVATAGLYDTTPVGTCGSQRYLNSAALVETDRTPDGLLQELQDVEWQLGRRREAHWGPRPVDLDLVWFGDVVCETPRLTLPHPACWYRRFVLEPLAEVAPHWRHPDRGLTVEALRDRWRRRPVEIALAGGTKDWRDRLRHTPPTLSPGVILIADSDDSPASRQRASLIAWRGESPEVPTAARPRGESSDPGFRALPADRRLDVSREAALSDDWLTFVSQSVGDEPRRIAELDLEIGSR